MTPNSDFKAIEIKKKLEEIKQNRFVKTSKEKGKVSINILCFASLLGLIERYSIATNNIDMINIEVKTLLYGAEQFTFNMIKNIFSAVHTFTSGSGRL